MDEEEEERTMKKKNEEERSGAAWKCVRGEGVFQCIGKLL